MANQLGRVELALMCMLTDLEVKSRGSMLGDTIWAIAKTKSKRTADMKAYKDLLTGMEENQRKLAQIIREQAEERMVDCVVQFHTPCEGIKRIIRTDTGEVVKEDAMTNSEKQLNLFDSQLEFQKFMESQNVDQVQPEAEQEAGSDLPTSED